MGSHEDHPLNPRASRPHRVSSSRQDCTPDLSLASGAAWTGTAIFPHPCPEQRGSWPTRTSGPGEEPPWGGLSVTAGPGEPSCSASRIPRASHNLGHTNASRGPKPEKIESSLPLHKSWKIKIVLSCKHKEVPQRDDSHLSTPCLVLNCVLKSLKKKNAISALLVI